MHTLTAGETMQIEGVDVQIEWAGSRVPVYVAAYGPSALTLAGKAGDGVIFQTADPYFIEWGMQWVRKGAEEAGRDLSEIMVHCSSATYITGDQDEARERTRWFPALVGNHIAEVLQHNNAENLPPALDEYIQRRTEYDYLQHGHPGADHSKYVPDEITDRFCVNGTEEQIEAKLRELAALGVTEFNIYPYIPNLLETIDVYGRRIVPRINSAISA